MNDCDGFCECGCGNKTNLATSTDSSRGWVKGKPLRYLLGHQGRKSGVDYVVDPITGCWLWQLSLNNKGYGRINVNGVVEYAHRVFYKRHNGEIPEGLELDHKCSNRACVNPDHLEPVTHTVNLRRGAKTKYTIESIKLIRKLKSDGLGSRQISKMLDMPRSTVGFIMSGKRWKDAECT